MATFTITKSNTVVSGTDYDDSFHGNYGDTEYVTIHAGQGNDTVWGGNAYYVEGADGNDYLNADSNSTLIGGSGDDSLGVGYNSYAIGGDGNDSLVAVYDEESKYATLDGGGGDDTIINGNAYASIIGGVGNDSIYNFSWASGSTINGGEGNDTIDLSNSGSNVIQYASGDGNDVIVGYNYAHDTLQIAADSYSTTATNIRESESLFDVVVQFSNGSITLKDLNYSGLENFSLNISGAQITGDSSTSTANSAGTVSDDILTADNNAYTYSGGNQTISSYAGEKINYNTDFTGLGFAGTGAFVLNSSSGSLTIKTVGGNTVAYAYLASYAGEINGSGISQFEVIIGGSDSANTIKAGDGGSSLWGGSGGEDILTGGAGIDTFFWGKNDGSDVITNASSSDVVYLYDVSLENIISAKTEGNEIYVRFDTGCDLLVESSENLSATFKLADGNFKFNHSSGEWQNA